MIREIRSRQALIVSRADLDVGMWPQPRFDEWSADRNGRARGEALSARQTARRRSNCQSEGGIVGVVNGRYRREQSLNGAVE